eukprot:SAG31_NODE_5450_length_2532_cov_1.197698_1_plen_423_part_01
MARAVDSHVAGLQSAIEDVEAPQNMLVNVGDTMSKLRDGIAWVDAEIRRQVTDGREDLLSQVRVLHAMEAQLGAVKGGAENLAAMVARIRTEMSGPYAQMDSCVGQLERLYTTSALLRDVQHFLLQCKKLRSHMDAAAEDEEAAELERAAACAFEIDRLRTSRQHEFARLPILHGKMTWAGDTGTKIRSRAHSLLFKAVGERKQTKTANTLQAFSNLGVGALLSTVDSVITQISDSAKDQIRSALDPAVLAAEMKATAAAQTAESGKSSSGAAQRMAAAASTAANLKLVSLVSALLDKTMVCCGDIMHVQTVLGKKHDPQTGLSLGQQLSDIGASGLAAADFVAFWKSLSGVLTRQLATTFCNDFVKGGFVAEYPQILGLFKTFLRQLRSHGTALSSTTADMLLSEDAAPEASRSVLNRLEEQ